MTDSQPDALTFLFLSAEGATALVVRKFSSRASGPIADVIRSHGGRVFDASRNRLRAVFNTPQEAAAAVVAVQRMVRTLSNAYDGVGSLRAALHSGRSIASGSSYSGETLRRCDYLLDAANIGQILVSQAARDRLVERQPDDVRLIDLGRHRLKDLTRAETIYQLDADGLDDEFPPLRTLDLKPNNLPVLRTSLIGREQDVSVISRLLQGPMVGLVTLLGPSGTGKTRLGLQAAADLIDDFEDGVCFVALAPISDPGLVPSAIARALGIRETGEEPLIESLKGALRDKKLLLVLDNFEQLLDATPLVRDLLADAPGLKLLVTSQEPLDLMAEHTVAVPPLALPASTRLVVVETLLRYPSVSLFIERARTVNPAFELSSENAAAVATICTHLEGLPLAIELVAAYSDIFTPQEMQERLHHRVSPGRQYVWDDLAPHLQQETLRAVLEWSYELLDEQAQQLFACMGIFVGGCGEEAVEQICLASAPDGATLQRIQQLLSRNLLQADVIGRGSRWTMLDMVHEYAVERLDASGQLEQLAERHAAYYRGVAERSEPELERAERVTWLEWLESEHHNLRSALGWAIGRGHAETAVATAGALWRFWMLHGYLSEGRRWLEASLELEGEVAPSRRAWATNGAGVLAAQQGDYDQARRYFDMTLQIRRQLGDPVRVASTMYNLANVLFYEGKYDQAIELLDGSLGILRQHGNNLEIANTLLNLADVTLVIGDAARALTLLQEARGLFQDLGETDGLAHTYNNLGDVAVIQQNADEAESCYRESLRRYFDVGNQLGIAEGLEGLAWVSGARGQSRRALKLWAAADALRTAIGSARTPMEQSLFEPLIEEARQKLGGAAAAVWAEGQSTPAERAVELALE